MAWPSLRRYRPDAEHVFSEQREVAMLPGTPGVAAIELCALPLSYRHTYHEARSGRWPSKARLQLFCGIAAALLVPSAFAGGSSSAAPGVREALEVQSLLTGEFGFARPAGLTYVRKKGLLFVAQSRGSRTRLLRLTPFEKARGVVDVPRLARPSTLAFDPLRERAVAVTPKKLATIQSSLTPGRAPVALDDIAGLRLREPQAVTFDTGERRLLILDTAAREIIRAPLSPGGSEPVRISLRSLGPGRFRGLAYSSADRLVYVSSPDRQLLYGLDRTGKLRKVFSLRSAALQRLTGIVFAPSTDPTDPPRVQHLFAADTGGPNALGRIVELSLERRVSLAASTTGRLVRTIQTSKLPSRIPDPSGIAYVPATDQLLVADSEVEELPMYRGANLFYLTRTGSLAATGSTVSFCQEPSGIAFDPEDSTLYLTDDDKKALFVDRPGTDGRYGTADDVVTRISTSAFGSKDPEDVALDPTSGHVFVADGVGAEIYDVDPVNAAFGDGNDKVTHFDVATYGVRNIEGLGFDVKRRTLLVVADRERRILELTRSGGLVRVISLAPIPGTRWLSGVTMAPTSSPSDPPGAMSYWLTDRQFDNNQKPNEVDGRIYEVVLP